MNFRRLVSALHFHSSTKLPLDYEVARLVRVREDARWREYDEPTYIRKGRAQHVERSLPALLMKQAS